MSEVWKIGEGGLYFVVTVRPGIVKRDCRYENKQFNVQIEIDKAVPTKLVYIPS